MDTSLDRAVGRNQDTGIGRGRKHVFGGAYALVGSFAVALRTAGRRVTREDVEAGKGLIVAEWTGSHVKADRSGRAGRIALHFEETCLALVSFVTLALAGRDTLAVIASS